MPTTSMQNPRTRAAQRYVTAADAEAFHERFLTLRTMARAYGRNWQSLSADLARHGIETFSTHERDYGSVYLREDVEGKLGKPDR